jgi:hypothetical protein
MAHEIFTPRHTTAAVIVATVYALSHSFIFLLPSRRDENKLTLYCGTVDYMAPEILTKVSVLRTERQMQSRNRRAQELGGGHYMHGKGGVVLVCNGSYFP